MLRGERSPAQKWSSRDAMLAQALEAYESLICSGCGQPMHESMDPENEGRYVAPPPMRCHACTAVQQSAKPYYEKSEAPEALRFVTVLDAPRGAAG